MSHATQAPYAFRNIWTMLTAVVMLLITTPVRPVLALPLETIKLPPGFTMSVYTEQFIDQILLHGLIGTYVDKLAKVTKMYQCYFCKGNVVTKTVTHMHAWQGKFFLFEDVPAEVCQQCGEIYFRPEVLKAIDTIVTGDVEPKAQVAVPVFSISDIPH